MKSKYFYEQHGEEIAKEVKEFEAYEKKTILSSSQCSHKSARFHNNKLICTCGAVWTGAGLSSLQALFTK